MYREEDTAVPFKALTDLEIHFGYETMREDGRYVIDESTIDLITINELPAEYYTQMFLEEVLEVLARSAFVETINTFLDGDMRAAEADRAYDEKRDRDLEKSFMDIEL